MRTLLALAGLCLAFVTASALPASGQSAAPDLRSAPTGPSADLVQSGYLLVTAAGNKCLDISEGNQGNGAALDTWECHGGSVQRWRMEGGLVRSDLNNKCLNIIGGQSEQGAGVNMYDCHSEWPAQRWYWDGGRIRSENGGRCLSVGNSNPWPGAAILIWDCGGGTGQQWRIG